MKGRWKRTLWVALIGAGLGWLARPFIEDRIELPGPRGETVDAENVESATPESRRTDGFTAAAPGIEAMSIDPIDVIAVEEFTGLNPVIAAPPPSDAVEAEPLSLPPANTPVAEVSAAIDPIVAVADPAAVADAILSELLSPAALRCEFGFGNGGSWAGGTLTIHDAQWQGGPVIYQSVNLDAGTAQLVGSVGATDSLDGTIDARVVATPVGLHFLALTPNGHLITTTVYNERDDFGRFASVMSRHEGDRAALATEGAQFYGSCD